MRVHLKWMPKFGGNIAIVIPLFPHNIIYAALAIGDVKFSVRLVLSRLG